MAQALRLSTQAKLSMQDAYDRLRQAVATVSTSDAREFSNTTLEDVFTAARQIETELAAKGSLRNTRRLKPFLDGLEQYSKVMEILCNGTPFLPWIWVKSL
jgi:hypothetical protein